MAVMLFAWFGAGSAVAAVLALTANQFLDLLLPISIQGVSARGSDVMVTTSYLIGGAEKRLLGMMYHPLEQGFGFPLYIALTLTTPSRPLKLLLKLLAGSLLTLAVLLWGLVFAVLDNLFVQTGLALTEWPSLGAVAEAAIGLGNALGVLILPTVAPLLLWLALNWDFTLSLVGSGKGSHLSEEESKRTGEKDKKI